jgi:hypothetical protein
MANKAEREGEHRWIILSEDGRYAPMRCSSEPTQDEIREAEGSLRTSGLAGWLAIMDGMPYGTAPSLLQVRSLANPSGPTGTMRWPNSSSGGSRLAVAAGT